jgi:hypothetical protein
LRSPLAPTVAIRQAVIKRLEDTWPTAVVLRLHSRLVKVKGESNEQKARIPVVQAALHAQGVDHPVACIPILAVFIGLGTGDWSGVRRIYHAVAGVVVVAWTILWPVGLLIGIAALALLVGVGVLMESYEKAQKKRAEEQAAIAKKQLPQHGEGDQPICDEPSRKDPPHQ